MTETVGGARKGDVVGYQNDAEADALVAAGVAVETTFDAEKGEYIDAAAPAKADAKE